MDPKNFKAFVMFRVGEILESTNLNQWNWVPSKLNPADLATKIGPSNDALWLNGPTFLKCDSNTWPIRPDLGDADKEEVRNIVLVIDKTTSLAINVEYFSNWKRLYIAL
ncbi:hypothetical protein EVAR_65811_1 [Eumeta japonica]|uniref:Uncharacterized protein n=1 Tax=Eumeta variegata TaxID=151549 RepID=A0A4C1TIU8_EUMVA|nr:hypothetical protein EVAR_65811_1 [Eumeta japonica]